MKKLLHSQLGLEECLINYVEECLKRIYGKDAKKYIAEFSRDLETGYDYNGCLQGLYFTERSVYFDEVKGDKDKLAQWDKENPYKPNKVE